MINVRFLVLLSLLFCLFGGTAWSKSISGTVTRVLAGDTIVVSENGSETEYPLIGIASPVAGQPLSAEARSFTESLLLGKTVHVTPSFRQIDRTWAAKIVADGRDVRFNILLGGYAWCYMTNEKGLKGAEKNAKKQKKGIWGTTNPVPPWEFKSTPTSYAVIGKKEYKQTNYGAAGLASATASHGSADGDAPVRLFTNNDQLASDYGDNSVLIHSRHKEVELMSKEAPKLPPSKYDGYLDSVVVIRSGNSLGSGFFIDGKGHIVTNHHVVNGASRVKVLLRDGTPMEGSIVSVDRSRDLALVEVSSGRSSWLGLGTIGDAGIGTEVMAIGAPEGLSWSVSKGIVSAIRSDGEFTLVQTDTAINRGNSGGPLISLESGKVVGVNTFGVRKDVAEGINFAVGVNEIRQTFSKYVW